MMTKEQDNDELCMNDGDSCIEYRSLNDIRLRKEALRKSIEMLMALISLQIASFSPLLALTLFEC